MDEPADHDASIASEVEAGGDVLDALGRDYAGDEDGARRLLAALHRGLGVEVREERIGRYVVLAVLGRGGAGVVYRARDEELGRDVAVKVLAPSLGRGDATTQGDDRHGVASAARLQREAQALARVEHDNVVRVFDVGTYRDAKDVERVYLVMELVEGETLVEWFGRRPSVAEIVDAGIQAARGLAAAHAVGIIHRDFKPGNAIRDARGVVRVLDFGLARGDLGVVGDPVAQTGEHGPPRSVARVSNDAMAPGSIAPSSAEPSAGEPLTRADQVVGTPPYMAPEQLRAEPIDARVDQYALCVALFEGITGTRAFPQHSVGELIAAKRTGALAPAAVGLVAAPLFEVIARGMAPDPDARFVDMHALAGALRTAIAPRRGRWVLGAAAVGALITGLVLRSPDPCATSPVAPWDATDGERVRVGFLATDLVYAEAAAVSVAERLAAYTTTLESTWQEACAANESAELLAASRKCLEARRVDLVALTDELASADARLVVRADRAIDALPDPMRCRAPSEADLTIDAGRSALRRELAAQQRAIAERRGDTPALRALVERAHAAGEPSIEAQARLAIGTIESGGRDPTSTRDEIERAALVAEAAGDFDVAAEAWYFLAHEQAIVGHLDDARAALRHADAAAANTPANPSRERAAWAARWAEASVSARYDEALVAAERAYEASVGMWGPEDARTGDASSRLAVALRRTGRLDEAVVLLEAAIVRTTAGLGPTDPDLVMLRGNLAITLGGLGRHAAAIDQLGLASDVLDARGELVTEQRIRIDVERVASLHRLGRDEEAEAIGRARLAALAQAPVSPGTGRAALLMNVGTVLLARGDVDGALRHLDESLAMLVGLGEDGTKIPEVRGELARALVAADRHAEAVDHAMSAVVLARKIHAPQSAAAQAIATVVEEVRAAGQRALVALRRDPKANRTRIAALERALSAEVP